MAQIVHQLSSSELSRLEAQRKWVREHYEPQHERKFDTVKGKVTLISGILDNKWIQPNETPKLQSLGVAFGDALAQELGLKWVAIEDEYGRDPALILENTSFKLFPITMISKRIERGESVNAIDLFSKVCVAVMEFKQNGA